MIGSQVETIDYVMTKTVTKHKLRSWTSGTQKQIGEKYVCKKCKFTESFDEPLANVSWKCKRCNNLV